MANNSVTRRDFLKVMGAALLGGVVAGCVPDDLLNPPDPTRTALPTVTPVPGTLTPTASPQPSETPAPTAAAAQSAPTAEVISQDVLTQAQKEHLHQAALSFEARTEAEAIRVARSLAYVQGDGHPASMCGPLSVAILRNAGLLNPYIDLHDFWLLNPRSSQDILEKVFPVERFEYIRVSESIRTFDFKAFPLKAGDFLYLFAGNSGSFEHMLTVSRVDEQGRAYSVTNVDSGSGYSIGERMLYDPNNPGEGQFYAWTDRKYAMIGMTGFGGFLLIRFAAPVHTPDDQAIALAQQIDQLLERTGGDWKILIRELDGIEVYSRRSLDRVHVASVIKLAIAVLFMKSLETLGKTDLQGALETGTGGRSYRQLLKAMLVDSEEDAAEVLQAEINTNQLNIPRTLEAWGLKGIDLVGRRATVQEMVQMAELLYQGQLVGAEATQILLDLLETYTPNDETRLGVIRGLLPAGSHIYNKRGTITDSVLVVGDLAVISSPVFTGKGVYTLGIFAYQGTPLTTYEKVDAAVQEIALAFWQYAQAVANSGRVGRRWVW
ncbi:MAG: class A beta-lactamase-related serine hydrolase [Anaerolineales bacterium]|jgi:hypothetical protein|nr:class A beta-lactamase-related serine hydrolase [Anaerolineales bacterium]